MNMLGLFIITYLTAPTNFEILSSILFMESLKHFFEQKIVMFVAALLVVAGAFAGGLYLGTSHVSAISQVTDLTNKEVGMSATTTADFSMFWTVWNLLDQKYVATHASTTDSAQQRVYGAIEGMVASLGDPYTVFFPPEDAALFQSEIQGNFGGIGLEIGIKDGNVVAVSALKGTPADKAGIRPGDIIQAVGTTTTNGLSTDQVVEMIRGDKGTKVTLTIVRDPKVGPFTLTLTRDTINVPTIDTKSRPDGIFVITLYSFTQDSGSLFRDALKTFVTSGDHKLILDLRGNPGGYLDAAVDMASWFLPSSDEIVKEDYGPGKTPDVYMSKGYNIFNNNLKMVILVDGGTASAAEILSGALSEHGVATLVGQRTFGKGSVQELVPLPNNASLKVTVARWLTPNGSWISQTGILPDVWATTTVADIASGTDPQMDKAVGILESQP